MVELGTGYGYSTAWILLALNHNNRGVIHSYDREERKPSVWEKCRIETDRLYLHLGEFENNSYLPKDIDFLFHDSQHRIELITKDLDFIMPNMSKNSIIVIHDTKGQVGEMLKEKYTDWKCENDPLGCGITILKRGE